MKLRFFILFIILLLSTPYIYSQDRNNKGTKEERRLEKQKQVDKMINDKEFVFVPRTALPAGMSVVNLSPNQNSIKFHPDFIDSFMPFFGRAYNVEGYGRDTGLQFSGKPDKFTIEKKGKMYQINVVVKEVNDMFSLFLSVGVDGFASLSVSSNNRSPISFEGEISAPEKAADK
jgi:hypothetical protein